jgi:hypothetical protein
MADNNIFQGEMDPEIAALLGTAPAASSTPDFASIFSDTIETDDPGTAPEVDLHAETFPEVKNRFSEPHDAFNNANYYKIALSGEGDISQRVHTIMQKYLNAKDPKDRSVYRQQFITAYWEFLFGIAKKSTGRLPDPKKYLLRFGILHPTFIEAETRAFFAKIVVDNVLNQPIYYLDEWFKAIGTGVVRNSSTDEVRIAKNNSQLHMQQLLEKAMGKLDGSKNLLRAKNDERINFERILQERVNILFEHYPLDGFPDVQSCYTEAQKRGFGEIQEALKFGDAII